jgi:SMODS-associating 2TM, beta-strand rich effector domain
MRLTSSQTWAIVGFASLLWLALSAVGLASGGGPAVILTFADVIPALLLLGSIFERWLWRWPLLHLIGLNATPVVIGTWRGDLESFWEDPVTKARPPIKTVYLTIRQTATTVTARLVTNESASEQIAGLVTKGESGYPAISYNYRNEPDLKFRENNVSPIHYGGAIIEIVGDPATRLKGRYWTDRSSRGEFTFGQHSPEIAQSFEEAEAMTFGAPRPVGVFDGFRRLVRTLTDSNAAS